MTSSSISYFDSYRRWEAGRFQTALSVLAGLVPAIHVAPFRATPRVSGSWTTWMTGTSPVMAVLLS
jgi:hypothetical protein